MKEYRLKEGVKMGFLKGEWRQCQADGDGCSCHMIWSIDNDCVVAVAIGAKDVNYTGGDGIVDESVIRANARLIAQAPRLYEVLKDIKQYVLNATALSPTDSQVIAGKCYLAIASVEGK